MDRFALSLSLGYPSENEELQMLERHKQGMALEELQPAVTLDDLQSLCERCRAIAVERPVQQYILNLVRATRSDEEISLGVSPRGAVALQRSGQALAFLQERDYVLPDDIKELARAVLAHRLIPSGGRDRHGIIDRLLRTVPVP